MATAKPMKPGTFVLRTNLDAKKHPEKKWPTLKGKYCDNDGREFWISAYVNTNEDGSKWISGRVEKEIGERSDGHSQGRAAEPDDQRTSDDDIPF